MLVIRKEQMEAFNRGMRSRFITDAALRLRGRHGDALASLTEEELFDLVEAAVDEARSFDCTLAEDIHAYLDLSVLFEWRLPEESWARRILDNGLLNGPARIRQLEEHPAVAVRRGPDRG